MQPNVTPTIKLDNSYLTGAPNYNGPHTTNWLSASAEDVAKYKNLEQEMLRTPRKILDTMPFVSMHVHPDHPDNIMDLTVRRYKAARPNSTGFTATGPKGEHTLYLFSNSTPRDVHEGVGLGLTHLVSPKIQRLIQDRLVKNFMNAKFSGQHDLELQKKAARLLRDEVATAYGNWMLSNQDINTHIASIAKQNPLHGAILYNIKQKVGL